VQPASRVFAVRPMSGLDRSLHRLSLVGRCRRHFRTCGKWQRRRGSKPGNGLAQSRITWPYPPLPPPLARRPHEPAVTPCMPTRCNATSSWPQGVGKWPGGQFFVRQTVTLDGLNHAAKTPVRFLKMRLEGTWRSVGFKRETLTAWQSTRR
jgi:hypothetical protein